MTHDTAPTTQTLTYGQAGYVLSLFEQHLMRDNKPQPHYAQKITDSFARIQHPNTPVYMGDALSETVLTTMNAQHGIDDKATFAQIRLNAAAQTSLDSGNPSRIMDLMNMSIQEITVYANVSVASPSLRQYLHDLGNVNDFVNYAQANHNMFGMRYLNHHHKMATQRADAFQWDNLDGDLSEKADTYLRHAYNV